MPIVVKKLNCVYMQGSIIEQTALCDIDLTVNDGEFLGIIGHTGSGKSTLIQHLNGLITASSGNVTVDGYDMSVKEERVKGRRLVGMVFQYPEYQLFEETVARDIAFGPKNMGLEQAEIDHRVSEAMSLVGLAEDLFAEKSPFELSGGEKRRVALAGIIAMRPKYLVLDEPMAGLDPGGRKNVLSTIERLREKTGCAIVMVTHSMDDIARTAERIVVLNHGQLALEGTPREIFSDASALEKMGLDLPQAAQLGIELKKCSPDVPNGIFLDDELFTYLKGRLADV
ncbi:MAG: energy-coupling factor transporter ATPase [Bacillota bacterium]